MNKFNAKKCRIDGFIFDSKKEAARYLQLKFLIKAGEISDLQIHPVFSLIVNGIQICKYIADFCYFDNKKGCLVYEDVKGYKKGAAYAVFTLKKKLLNAIYGIEVMEV